jgi:hypothetical protein
MTALAASAETGSEAPVLPRAAARGITFLVLAAFGALHWMAMLEPAEPGRAWAAVGVGALAAAVMLGAARAPGAWRIAAAIAAVVPLAALALLAGRVDHGLLRPDRWGELSSGISRGMSDLPGIRVPYRGIDEWVRTVIPLGGSALVLLAALLAFWPRRRGLGHPVAALIVLFVLYAVPAVALDFRSEFLRGAALALLVLAFLRLEKLHRPDAAGAAALAVAAALAAAGLGGFRRRDLAGGA